MRLILWIFSVELNTQPHPANVKWKMLTKNYYYQNWEIQNSLQNIKLWNLYNFKSNFNKLESPWKRLST